MRFLKLVFISIATLFILATALSALFPSIVIVSRAVDVTAPADSIMVHIKDMRQWKNWIDGMNDSSVRVHSATAATLGGTEVTITQLTDTTVQSTWRARKGAPQISTIRLISNPAQKQTVVQWQFEQRLKWYPWEKLGSIMNDKILGPMMEKNLANLKKMVETTD